MELVGGRGLLLGLDSPGPRREGNPSVIQDYGGNRGAHCG